MTHEDAESIFSDPTGHSAEDVAAATAILGLTHEGDVPSLTSFLLEMEKKASLPAEKAILNELAVIVGEAKMRLTQVASKVNNEDHIAHAILEYFQHL